MKFLFSSSTTSLECGSSSSKMGGAEKKEFHKNIFSGLVSQSAAADDYDDDDEENYMLEEEDDATETRCEYSRELEKSSKRFKLKHLSLPLSGTLLYTILNIIALYMLFALLFEPKNLILF